MVEGTGLENRHTGEPGIESSNLSLSVSLRRTRGRVMFAMARDTSSARRLDVPSRRSAAKFLRSWMGGRVV